jgi:hypothetical protein
VDTDEAANHQLEVRLGIAFEVDRCAGRDANPSRLHGELGDQFGRQTSQVRGGDRRLHLAVD